MPSPSPRGAEPQTGALRTPFPRESPKVCTLAQSLKTSFFLFHLLPGTAGEIPFCCPEPSFRGPPVRLKPFHAGSEQPTPSFSVFLAASLPPSI